MSTFEEKLEKRTQKAREDAKNLLLNPGNIIKEEEKVNQDPLPEDTKTIPIKDPSAMTSDLLSAESTAIIPPDSDSLSMEEYNNTEIQAKSNRHTPLRKKNDQEKEQKEDQTLIQQYAYRPKVHKREKIHESHTSQAYMIEKELIGIINDIVGDTWGGKYRFVNEAIKLMIYQEFPEFAERIRVKE